MKSKPDSTNAEVGQSCRSAGAKVGTVAPRRPLANSDALPFPGKIEFNNTLIGAHGVTRPTLPRKRWGELSERTFVRETPTRLSEDTERSQNVARIRKSVTLVLMLLLCLLSTTTLQAGLPQPMFVYYGQAKDGFGIPYQENAEVVLLKDGRDIARSPIEGSRVPGVNFALYTHIDDGQGNSNYVAKAVRVGDFVSIVVRDQYGQQTIMEQGKVPPVGKPGEAIAINVTAAEDVDGDLLPDQWEEEMLNWTGGDFNGIHEINPEDDYDGDGQNNGQEYRAGTFAFLDYDYFFAEAMQVTENGRLAITFWGVPGKVYSSQHKSSLNETEWTTTPLAVNDTDEFANTPLVGQGDWLTLYLPKDPGNRLFRLRVE